MGCLALVMACVFMCLWIRGTFYFERVVIPHRKTYSVFRSCNPVWPSCLGVTWAHHWNDPTAGPFKILSTKWETYPTYTEERIRELKLEHALEKSSPTWAAEENWEWEWHGFLVRTGRDYRILAVPYWSLVWPLTLLAAYLILWTPRKSYSPNQLVSTREEIRDSG